MQAVEIEAVEAGSCRVYWERVIVFPQPLKELYNIGVAPHPCGEPTKASQRFNRKPVVARASYIAIDTVGVWPISLDSYGLETFFLNEPLRDLSTVVVKLVRTVGRLSEQYDVCLADQVEEQVVVSGRRRSTTE